VVSVSVSASGAGSPPPFPLPHPHTRAKLTLEPPGVDEDVVVRLGVEVALPALGRVGDHPHDLHREVLVCVHEGEDDNVREAAHLGAEARVTVQVLAAGQADEEAPPDVQRLGEAAPPRPDGVPARARGALGGDGDVGNGVGLPLVLVLHSGRAHGGEDGVHDRGVGVVAAAAQGPAPAGPERTPAAAADAVAPPASPARSAAVDALRPFARRERDARVLHHGLHREHEHGHLQRDEAPARREEAEAGAHAAAAARRRLLHFMFRAFFSRAC
jgi:hypothetical protein